MMLKNVSILALLFLLSSCGTTPIEYKPSTLKLDTAKEIVEELTWSQHPTYRPSGFEINDKYMAWDFGVKSESSGMAVGNGTVTGISGTTTSKNIGERSYFKSIDKVELFLWKRKFRTWYTVSLTEKNNTYKYVYRTQSLEDAEKFTDAMSTIVKYYKEQNTLQTQK